MIRVALADDQDLIRTAVAELVSHEPGLSVVGQAANGREAIGLAQREKPDVMLMDIRMPVMDGIQATAAICADPALAATRIVVLTTFEEDEYVLQALRAGASGFVGKGTDAAQLMNAIRVVHDGESLLSPIATKALINRYLAPAAPAQAVVPAGLALLTEREVEILLRVARGHSNAVIAQDLVISPHTAKTHVNRMMAKLGSHDRAQLVIIAYETGLIAPGEV